ncbi:transcriptional regulator, LysR family [Beutenbergia cavernae DSM 12333]|uniref:Transcriptional regulator, LysR family n=1 Tax=Beutenbergia cavernae (strain ATCC BAA-8 / DSM 12333 / CCUG 43141 / JCM 11478 / NBRC 16432 / NCIMB 13614 / HKI 0122) TaxID=471853 RepID=C5BXB2_BEUC1|nr:LysR family transcriptional regulator [Beutenbergia cavernae]ACQ78787.1 transcriptional regulator, LysR family [Beutenbergia cavernae DSM 12333]
MEEARGGRGRGATLDELRLLVDVADQGSISAAARAQLISQPSASARMRTLERRLGLELVDRRTRGAELTEHGRVVTDWARAVVAAADTLVTGAEALAARRDEHLRLAASQTVAEYLVPGWLAELRRRDGEHATRLRVANSRDVVAALRARDVDLGFVEGPSVPADLRSREVATDRLVLVVAPDHPLARRRRPLTREDLAALPLASREDGSGTRDTVRRALGRDMAPPAVELDSNAAVKVVVVSGGFAAVMSELAVAAELRDGRLVEAPLEGVDLRRSLRAVWRRDAGLSRAAEAMIAVAGGRRR